MKDYNIDDQFLIVIGDMVARQPTLDEHMEKAAKEAQETTNAEKENT